MEDDGVLAYAKEVLSLALLWAEFEDAIKEGDSLRVIKCWKFFLPIFKVTNHKNYAIRALNLLIQYNFFTVSKTMRTTSMVSFY